MYTQNAEVLPSNEGFWVNLDKSCCDPLTEQGEVVYFETKEQALRAIFNDEKFINKMLELTDDNTEQ